MKPLKLKRVTYSNALQDAYSKVLRNRISEMHHSMMYWMEAKYRQNPLGDDDSDINNITEQINSLKIRWGEKFNNLALFTAPRFVSQVERQTTGAFKRSLVSIEIPTVKFTMTPAMQQAVEAIVENNVGLIKSIPEQYFAEVRTIVLQAVSRGNDSHYLTQELQKRLGITKRRADFIARDQTSKATSSLAIIRQQELGITKGTWIHSGGGKHPRKKHVEASGKEFDLSKGLPVGDNGEWVLPGQEINCRCIWRPIIDFMR